MNTGVANVVAKPKIETMLNFSSSGMTQFPSITSLDYVKAIYKPKSAYEYFLHNTKRVYRFDLIRLNKLMEIIQYSILYFIVVFVVASYIDKWFPKYNPRKKTYLVGLEVVAQMLVYILMTYYLRKIIWIVPPIVITKNYIPSLKQESTTAITIIGALAMTQVQPNFLKKIRLLSYRFLPRTNIL